MRIRPYAILAAALLACATTATKPVASVSAPTAAATLASTDGQGAEAFKRLLDEMWEAALSHHPELGTWLGDSRYNDRWTDITPVAIHAEEEAKRDYVRRLEAFDPSTLPEQDCITREVLVRDFRLELEEARFETWKMPLTTQFGIDLIPAGMPPLIRFASTKDYDDWIKRLHAIPKLFADLESNLRLGIAKGWVPPRYIVQKLADPAGRLATAPADRSPFAIPLAKMPDGIPDPEKQRIRGEICRGHREGREARLRPARPVPRHGLHGRLPVGGWGVVDTRR